MTPAEIFDLLTDKESAQTRDGIIALIITCISALAVACWFGFLILHSNLTF